MNMVRDEYCKDYVDVREVANCFGFIQLETDDSEFVSTIMSDHTQGQIRNS